MTYLGSLSNHHTREPFAAQFGTNVENATTVAQALEVAGLDWNIKELPADNLYINSGLDLVSTSVPDRKLLMRSDDMTTLGVVGHKYKSVSNADAFALADSAKALGAKFSYAGELDHGRKTFLTMTIPEATVLVGGHDAVEFGLILTTDHSGSGSITGEIYGSRLACTNGQLLTSPLATWSIRHTRTAHQRVVLAKRAMQHAFASAKEFAAYAEELISIDMSEQEFVTLLGTLFPRPLDGAPDSTVTRWHNRRDQLMALYSSADTQEEGRNTAWGALQSVLEWDQYFRPARGGEIGRAKRNFTSPDNSGVGRRTLELLTA